MDIRDVLITINQAIPVLQRLSSVLQDAHEAEQHAAQSVAKKDEAEKAYRQAHSERAQIIEAIENLKKQHESIVASHAVDYAVRIGDASASILVAKQTAERRIAELEAETAKAESDAAQRIASAVLEAEAVEARVKNAEAALEALKRA